MEVKSNGHSDELTPDEKVSEELERANHQFPIVGLGASAGGLKALTQFFENTPRDTGIAYVVILHLSPDHESNLDVVLRGATAMDVIQVTESVTVIPNTVYVIPPSKHLSMSDGQIVLSEPERPRGRRVPIDFFFRTLAETHGPYAGAVVLSGTGSDGTIGIARMKEYAGFTIAQDPREAEYSDMPRSAINTGLVDLVLPVEKMTGELVSYWANAEKIQLPPPEEPKSEDTSPSAEQAVREVLALLRSRTGHDYSQYKRSTILRRIARRMQVRSTETVAEYLQYMRKHAKEIPALENDMLISVTNFFRDPIAFGTLATEVIPKLFEGKYPSDTVRAWVAACATGEEAYSLAILLREYADTLPEPPSIQIFATDIDDDVISSAREGIFPETIAGDVTPERLARFFNKEQNTYRIKKEIREMVLFAVHNLLKDPPFSRLDLVSCRNLLIYLNKNAQTTLLELFHFALKPYGFLFLGTSESVDGLPRFFLPVNKREHIFERLNTAFSNHFVSNITPSRLEARDGMGQLAVVAQKPPNLAELHRVLLERHGSPSVLVDANNEIIHISFNTGRFLSLAPGEPSHNLLKVTVPDIRMELRTALYASDGSERPVSRRARMPIDGEEHYVDIMVVQIREPEIARGLKLVIFDDIGSVMSDAEPTNAQEGPIVSQMQDELQRTRDQLKLIIEQYETSTEELKASNEELQAINEELRSTTEELETSKEELQAVNEELQTVNQELKLKVDEVSWANSDLQNLLASTNIATMFLDRNLHVKRYTPQVQTLFNIIPSDVNRPLEHITNKLIYRNVAEDALQVLQNLMPIEREVETDIGTWYVLRLLPYRTIEDRIDGVVLTFIDITERKRVEIELQRTNDELAKHTKLRTNELLEANLTLRSEAVEREHDQQVRQELMKQLVTAQEEERRRISRELHDELGQLLTGLKFFLGSASRRPEGPAEMIQEAQDLVDVIMQRTRDLAANLRPSVLDDIGLLPAILGLLEQFKTQTGITVDFQHVGLERRLDADVEITIYRVVQEALTNIARHAEAKTVKIQIMSDGYIIASIEDDGIGFEPDAVLENASGRGLKGMIERVRLLDGQFTIDSAPGNGTRLTAEVPVEPEESDSLGNEEESADDEHILSR